MFKNFSECDEIRGALVPSPKGIAERELAPPEIFGEVLLSCGSVLCQNKGADCQRNTHRNDKGHR